MSYLEVVVRAKPTRLVVVKLAAFAAVACVLLATPASAEIYYGIVYSDASVGSDGTSYGWGVTDVWYYGVTHTASVSTTLISPNGRVAWSQAYYVPNYARVDVALAPDENDFGLYIVNSTHDAWCPIMGNIIIGELTSASRVRCGFEIQGVPQPTCDGTKTYVNYQAARIPLSGCTVYQGGSNLTFTVGGDVTAYPEESWQSLGVVPTLHAVYAAGPWGGSITPKFTINFNGTLTVYREKTDQVCR